MVEQEINWLEALHGTGEAYSMAVAELRRILLDGLRIALRERTDVSQTQLEDFTQEALLRILDRLDQFAGRSKFTTWAHTVAINTAFAELRRKRWQDVSLEALTEAGQQLSEASAPLEAVGQDEERARVLAALHQAMADKLSPRQRTVIAAMLQDLPVDQVVELLDTNRNAVYKLFYDARRSLKQHLAAEGISPAVIRSAFAS